MRAEFPINYETREGKCGCGCEEMQEAGLTMQDDLATLFL
jgi:hypothetical protein